MKSLRTLRGLAALILFAPAVQAASNAVDVASNYAGFPSYVNVDRGTGWRGGFSGSGSTVNAFLGSSGQIDTAGIAFGLGNGTVSRLFSQDANSSFLTPGQVFQCRLQPGTVAAGGQFSFSMVTTVDLSTQVRLQCTSGDADYTLIFVSYSSTGVSTTQVIDTGVPFSANALAVDLLRGVGSLTLSLTPAGGATTTLTNPYVGNLAGCGFTATNGTTMYFNNLAVIPEPKSSAALAFSLICLVIVCARKGRRERNGAQR